MTIPTEHQPEAGTRGADPALISDTLPELLDALGQARAHRQEHSGLTSAGKPEWEAFERTAMLDATTAILIRHELPLDADGITKAVTAAEQQAHRSSDYARAWALGCAQYISEMTAAQTSHP